MLTVDGFAPAERPEVRIDDLVVHLEWPAHPPLLYWRTGNFRSSLLEIGVDRADGRLVSVTLVAVELVGDWPPGETDPEVISDGDGSCVPICDLTRWSNEDRFVDESNELTLRLGTDRLSILWGPPPDRCVQCGPVRFGIDEHRALRYVALGELTAGEIAAIQSIFQPQNTS